MGLEILAKIPRTALYVLTILAIVIPLYVPLNLPLEVTPETELMFDTINDLQETGGVICFFHDIRPEMWGEFKHTYFALVQHFFKMDNNVKLVVLAGGPFSGGFFNMAVDLADHYGKEYGVDWVQMAPLIGRRQAFWAQLAVNFRIPELSQDETGQYTIDEIPYLDGIERINDFDVFIWLEKVGGGGAFVTTIPAQNPDVPKFICVGAEGFANVAAYVGPIYLSGLWGPRPAAEYQFLYGGPFSPGALAAQDALSVYHLLIVVLIILGNLAFLPQRLRQSGVT
jgi:hypothetical protein